MELARHHLADAADLPTPEVSGPPTPEDGDVSTTDNYAFAFDIDGVLIKGGQVIPEAIDAMKVLNGENEFGVKVYVPFSPNLPLADDWQTLHLRHQRWRQNRRRALHPTLQPTPTRSQPRPVHLRPHAHAGDGGEVPLRARRGR
jgi:hypothetical protein